ncbi:MAG: NADH-quinone oxidoreductase E subunit [Myxococcota bacterium]|jgi:NADH-quinone oxidoreductase E subunit
MVQGFSPENEQKFQILLARYPQKKAALIPALRIAQEQWDYLTEEVMTYVAGRLEVEPSEVMNTATFYTMLKKKPVGRFHIQVCTNLSCYLRGSDEMMTYIGTRLGLRPGETSADGRFTLDHVECLASCGTAPMMQVNDDYHENLGPKQVEALIAGWEEA